MLHDFLFEPIYLLRGFLLLRLVQHGLETRLSKLNRAWWKDQSRQSDAAAILGIEATDMAKTCAYTEARYSFNRIQALVGIVVTILFVGSGGLGWCESFAKNLTRLLMTENDTHEIIVGLFFVGTLAGLSQLLGLPFALYSTFVIEEKFGFNKQTVRGFFLDLIKSSAIGILLGGLVLGVILWIMNATGTYWWFYAWAALTIISLVAAWLYPTLLAPLFNKFTPLDDGELKQSILALAAKTGFKADGLFVMDASKRSGHANAYFTGIFGKKRIVLFDTLIQNMTTPEVIAVLAHELGHFKLHHVRSGMIRGLLLSLIIFAGIGAMLPFDAFYTAFRLDGVSAYGGLVVFSLWFGLLEFYLQPLQTWFSRRNEFAADAFAKQTLGSGETLASALKKLREKSAVMPIAHPLYSSMYYSHPPMLERIKSLTSQT